jgi:hypothetical protein
VAPGGKFDHNARVRLRAFGKLKRLAGSLLDPESGTVRVTVAGSPRLNAGLPQSAPPVVPIHPEVSS